MSLMGYTSLPQAAIVDDGAGARDCERVGPGESMLDTASPGRREARFRKACAAGAVFVGLCAAVLVPIEVCNVLRWSLRQSTITRNGGGVVGLLDDKGSGGSQCHTATRGEQCYRNVEWHMQKGFVSNPKWYNDLTEESTFEEFQAWMHKESHSICPQPCTGEFTQPSSVVQSAPAMRTVPVVSTLRPARASQLQPTPSIMASDDEEDAEATPVASAGGSSCHTATEGEKCYTKVKWAMDDGIFQHPEWYRGLTASSSFEKFQERLHTMFPDQCRTPCEPTGATAATSPTQKSTSEPTGTGDDECHIATHGEKCHEDVRWAMTNGIHVHPDWYPGLNFSSSFEAFQAQLHNNPTSECPKPCACHTAVKGDKCYDSIAWALTTGIQQHPSWYNGISASSPVEEVQARLHKDADSTCPLPCQPNAVGGTSLFCYVVARAEGYEADLVLEQKQMGIGIFACDGHAVLSSEPLPNGLESVTFKTAYVGTSESGTAANAQLFMNVWDAIRRDLQYKSHGWTIKVDPDSVLLPSRLKRHLSPFSGGSTFIKNCNKYGPNMFGVLEAFSLLALEAYYAGVDRCKNELHWRPWGEDKFMEMCLEHLGVQPQTDFNIVDDANCKGTRPHCGSKEAAAFHPFKTMASWLKCWRQTGE